MNKKYKKLAEKIWQWLNGRYENYDEEVNYIALMIENFISKKKKAR